MFMVRYRLSHTAEALWYETPVLIAEELARRRRSEDGVLAVKMPLVPLLMLVVESQALVDAQDDHRPGNGGQTDRNFDDHGSTIMAFWL